MINLADILAEVARRQPDQVAVAGPGETDRMTYGQLQDRIVQVAKALKEEGIQPGQCVGLHVPSGLDYIVANYAIWRCGACVVPIPVELTPGEKRNICENICLSYVLSQVVADDIFQGVREGVTQQLPDGTHVLAMAAQREPPAGLAATNAAFIRFSSGTTGAARGVVLSHETIYDRIHAANEGLLLGPSDRIIWLLSMSYHFAVSIVAYLSFGATTVLCPKRPRFGHAILETTARNQGTMIYASPSHYALMAADTSGLPLATVRRAISTAVALPEETAQAFLQRFGFPLTQAYGIIEVGLPCINLRYAAAHFDSVGEVLPGYKMRMTNAGLGPHLQAIAVQGKGILDAYYEPWQTRDQIMQEGWFTTGDLGEFDDKGCLFIRGRAKEMISVGGMKYFPQEVEQVLLTHPAIQEAAVYAHRRMQLDESGHARIVFASGVNPVPTEQQLRRYCAEYVAHFKVPEKITVVNDLPRTASGKVIRRAVVPVDQAAWQESQSADV